MDTVAFQSKPQLHRGQGMNGREDPQSRSVGLDIVRYSNTNAIPRTYIQITRHVSIWYSASRLEKMEKEKRQKKRKMEKRKRKKTTLR